MSALIAIVCIIIFVAGMWCYGLAFDPAVADNDTLQLLIFFGGVLLNTLALFIPFQILGHGRGKTKK